MKRKTLSEDTKRVPSKKKKQSEPKSARVDSFCVQKLHVAHVYVEGKDVYSAMLNQLLEDDKSKIYSVWFRWGRVGLAGCNKLECFGSDLEDAKAVFCKKFKDKTVNDWESRQSFHKVAGKYDLIELDDEEEEGQEADQNKEKSAPAQHEPSKLDSAIQALLALLVDVKKMEQQMSQLHYDSERAPLGKLTRRQIEAGYRSIKQISSLIDNLSKSRKGSRGSRRASANAAKSAAVVRKEIMAACSEFYTRIPHSFGMRVPPLIDSSAAVKEKLELLEALEGVEYVMNMVESDRKSTQNPLDLYYSKLHCVLKPLAKSTERHQLIERYVRNSHGSTHSQYKLSVLDVFECEKKDELDRFSDVGNRMLLWHGSRLTNWLGILGKGLQVAPPEAPVNGYMFGKGVYFADSVSKSANYAYPTRANNVGLVVLCEVALGAMHEMSSACYDLPGCLPEGKHSVLGLGANIPQECDNQLIEDGLKVPCGKLHQRAGGEATSLLYNEYVVYNRDYVKMRYLVKLRFDFQ